MGRMARGASFLKRLCALLGRDLIPRKPGRKPQAVVDKEKYVLCPPISQIRIVSPDISDIWHGMPTIQADETGEHPVTSAHNFTAERLSGTFLPENCPQAIWILPLYADLSTERKGLPGSIAKWLQIWTLYAKREETRTRFHDQRKRTKSPRS